MKICFNIILAIDDHWGISREGTIPWHLPADMRLFKEITIGGGNNSCIIGRKTYESIPEKFRPLPNRINIVLTKNAEDIPGVILANSMEDALAFAYTKSQEIFVIGGADVYQQCFYFDDDIAKCIRIYLTRVRGDFSCDKNVVWLKKILESDYVLVHQEDLPQSKKGVKGVFEIYETSSCQQSKTPSE